MMPAINKMIDRIAEPITWSHPFQRLYGITFLGILSPLYSHLPNHPFPSRKPGATSDASFDQTRADHSLGVAELVLHFCEAARLPKPTTADAVAWALLHDIATWPLSHTSEAAFASITSTTHKVLRRKMVMGDSSIPGQFRLDDRIRETGADPGRVLLLFDKIHKPVDPDLGTLHSFIHSAITPDTLEGIHRSRRALGIAWSSPREVLNSLEVDMIDTMVMERRSKPVLKFLREKRDVYDNYINRPHAIRFESCWSNAIRTSFQSVSLSESLELTEDDIVKKVTDSGLPPFRSIDRYKEPRKYVLNEELKNKRKLARDQRIEDLSRIFRSE